MNSNKVPKQLADIPMSDEVKNEWTNDPLNKTLDKWLSSGPSEMRLINLEDKHMRILKGYTKNERKELEDVKKHSNLGYFLSNIFRCYVESPMITEYYHIADKYKKECISKRDLIIKDVVDFYFDKAKFPEQKYYIELLTKGLSRYLNLNLMTSTVFLGTNKRAPVIQSRFTEDEIKAIDPRYMAFAVPAEDDDE